MKSCRATHAKYHYSYEQKEKCDPTVQPCLSLSSLLVLQLNTVSNCVSKANICFGAAHGRGTGFAGARLFVAF